MPIKDEEDIYTTLVEGKVAVTYDAANVFLTPNQQSIVSTNTTGIDVKAVDVFAATSWRKGVF